MVFLFHIYFNFFQEFFFKKDKFYLCIMMWHADVTLQMCGANKESISSKNV